MSTYLEHQNHRSLPKVYARLTLEDRREIHIMTTGIQRPIRLEETDGIHGNQGNTDITEIEEMLSGAPG